MISIEEYISRRKKEDSLNEYDIDARIQNIKSCIDYVFEYFNNYLNITDAEDKTILHNEKLEKYQKQLRDYDPDVIKWLVSILNDYNKQLNGTIATILKKDNLFYLYNSDSEFRTVSYDCYSNLIKRLPFLRDQTEMLFLFIKNYHRIQSEKNFQYGIPAISDEITGWIEKTWAKYQVNLLAFTSSWIHHFFDNEDIWPSTHRRKNPESWSKYIYDYKQKSNLFNIDSLYRKIPKKSFIKGKKQEFEVLLMYYWLHDIQGDNNYWQEYLMSVLPALSQE